MQWTKNKLVLIFGYFPASSALSFLAFICLIVVAGNSTASCFMECNKLASKGVLKSSVMLLSEVKKNYKKDYFGFVTVYGTEKQIKLFNGVLSDLKNIKSGSGDMLSFLDLHSGNLLKYKNLILIDWPLVHVGGSYYKRCKIDSKYEQLNRDDLYFIDIEGIVKNYRPCHKTVSGAATAKWTGHPNWAATQCGIVAHELIEMSWHGDSSHNNPHKDGVDMQNMVRKAIDANYGSAGDHPERTLVGESALRDTSTGICDAKSIYKNSASTIFEEYSHSEPYLNSIKNVTHR